MSRRLGDEFQHSSTQAAIRALHNELGGRETSVKVYEIAIKRGLFTPAQIASFARRAGIEYVRHALSAINPDTGFPYAYAVGDPNEVGPVQLTLWVMEELLTAPEAAEHLRQTVKELETDCDKYRRIWERFAARFGKGLLPPLMKLVEDDGAAA